MKAKVASTTEENLTKELQNALAKMGLDSEQDPGSQEGPNSWAQGTLPFRGSGKTITQARLGERY